MREAFTCLNPSLLGVEKCLITFDYEKQVGPNKFAQMLIHNNEFNHQSSAIPIYHVHPDVLYQTYTDTNHSFTEDNWCLHQSLLEHGICSIEPTKDSDTLGKYLCVVPTRDHDRLSRHIQMVFDSKMDVIGNGDLNDKCLALYGNTPMAGNKQRITNMDLTRAASVLQCLQLTEQRHNFPAILDINAACLAQNTATNTTQR